MKYKDDRLSDNTKIVTKQGGISLGGNSIELALKYLHNFILARVLGAELVGLYFLGFTILSFAALMAKLGLQEGTLKFISSFNRLKDKSKIQKKYD